MKKKIVISVKVLLRPYWNSLLRLKGLILFSFLKFFSLCFRPRISITYDNTSKPDGVGAQIQRILAIRSLAKNLELGYIHTGVSTVAVHPLDPYQTDAQLASFISELNRVFHIETDLVDDQAGYEVLYRQNLGFAFLFRIMAKSIMARKHFLIICLEPYGVSDHDRLCYQGIRDLLPNFHPVDVSGFKIGIHYRRGVGGMAIQKGEKISRELPEEYFVSIANQIIKEHNHPDVSVSIYTDAPSADLKYSPPVNQRGLWTNSPRFHNGTMDVLGKDPKILFEGLLASPIVVQGGDPLQAIKELAGLDVLIMSRSSFSYLAAVLNNHGSIYFPLGFWHRPKPSWIIVDEENLEIQN